MAAKLKETFASLACTVRTSHKELREKSLRGENCADSHSFDYERDVGGVAFLLNFNVQMLYTVIHGAARERTKDDSRENFR